VAHFSAAKQPYGKHVYAACVGKKRFRFVTKLKVLDVSNDE
jgi:hypothetical protein